MQTTAELVAGRELDALVAEKVMGWTVEKVAGPDSADLWRDAQGWKYGPDPKEFSTDIAAAWTVVEKLGGHIEIVHWADSDTWQVNIGGRDVRKPYTMPQPDWAETAPEAICRAALAAVGH